MLKRSIFEGCLMGIVIALIAFGAIIIFSKKHKITFDEDLTGKRYMVQAEYIQVNSKDSTLVCTSKPVLDCFTVPIPANEARDYVYDVVMKKDGTLKYLGARRAEHP